MTGGSARAAGRRVPWFASESGAALLVGTLAAAIAAGPAALRGAGVGGTWLTLAGSTAFVLGPLLVGVAYLRPVTAALYAVLTGLGLSAIPLALFAAKLKEATHHRPLGAVTFAVCAIVVVCLAIIAALRVVTWSNRGGSGASLRAQVRAGMGMVALAGPALLAGSAASTPAARGGVHDVVLALACAAVLTFVPGPSRVVKAASRVGLPVWVAVVGAGAVLGVSAAGDSARLASPALFAAFGWFLR